MPGVRGAPGLVLVSSFSTGLLRLQSRRPFSIILLEPSAVAIRVARLKSLVKLSGAFRGTRLAAIAVAAFGLYSYCERTMAGAAIERSNPCQPAINTPNQPQPALSAPLKHSLPCSDPCLDNSRTVPIPAHAGLSEVPLGNLPDTLARHTKVAGCFCISQIFICPQRINYRDGTHFH